MLLLCPHLNLFFKICLLFLGLLHFPMVTDLLLLVGCTKFLQEYTPLPKGVLSAASNQDPRQLQRKQTIFARCMYLFYRNSPFSLRFRHTAFLSKNPCPLFRLIHVFGQVFGVFSQTFRFRTGLTGWFYLRIIQTTATRHSPSHRETISICRILGSTSIPVRRIWYPLIDRSTADWRHT